MPVSARTLRVSGAVVRPRAFLPIEQATVDDEYIRQHDS